MEEGAKHHPIHLHCFRRSSERLRTWLTGFTNVMVGFTPNIQNEDAVKEIPLDKILLETDAPYFVPSRRTRPSKPWYAEDTAREISTII